MSEQDLPPERQVAAVLGWVVAGIGALILAGWLLDVPALRNPVPGQIEVKANTALGFLVSGLALGLSPWRRLHRLVQVVAGLVALLALVILLQYPAGRDWGVDEWLVADVPNAVGTVHPGRMAAPTALNFVLLGTALLLLGTRWVRVVAALSVGACGVAVLAFTGTLLRLPALDAFGPYTAMAAPTGITFLLLGTGVFLASGARLSGRARRHGLLIGFVGALLLLFLLGGAAVRNIRLLVDGNRRVIHTHEVLAKFDDLLIALQGHETGTRGFLLTGNEEFLEPARTAPAEVVRHLRELRGLVADNPRQLARVEQLEFLVAAKLASSARQAELRRRGATDEAQELVAAGEGKRLMDAIRAGVADSIAEENRLLDARQKRAETDTAKTMLALGSGLISCVLLLVAVYLRLRREIGVQARLTAALRRSEESLAVTLSSIGDGVLATDTAGRITLLNPVAEALTGWPLAEARGRPVTEVFRIIHEQTRAPVPIPVEKVLATGEVQDLANHTALLARDGTERAVADSAAPIRDIQGRILGVVLVFRDVTESRRAQAQLDRFFELSLDFLCIASEDGWFKRASPAVTDILGWTVEEFLAMPYLDQIHPDDRESAVAEVRRQAAGEKVMHYECRFRHKDGSWRLLSWRSVPYGGFMYATARDVTEARSAEKQIRALNARLQEHAGQIEAANVELRRSRAELQSLFESLPGLYLILAPDYKIVAVSDAYLKATMTRREAILGRGLFEVFPDNPDDPRADGSRNLRASIERVAARREPDTMAIQKYDVRRPDGVFEEKYWSPINSPLLDADGRLAYIIHRVEDVTEFVRRKASPEGPDGEAIRARLVQMEAEIFQSSQKVQTANQQLHVANQELESFSYSVSHDLRAPLRHVQGYVEMLSRETKGALSEKAQRYLRTIVDAAREMGELIDDLLAFSRMSRTEMTETEVDLGVLVAEVRSGLAPDLAGRDIRWTVGPLPRVRADAAMLRQVFANLLGNAVKYTRRRAVAEIAVGCAGEEAGRPVLQVRDNGAGFDMKYADKLFGVFQRLHRTDEFEGTGIGLASVRRIVGRHGGRIWAEARVGEGATFYFTLPPAAENRTGDTPL